MSELGFNELKEKLYKLGQNDGDLGYSYWYNVIKSLSAMREKAWMYDQLSE